MADPGIYFFAVVETFDQHSEVNLDSIETNDYIIHSKVFFMHEKIIEFENAVKNRILLNQTVFSNQTTSTKKLCSIHGDYYLYSSVMLHLSVFIITHKNFPRRNAFQMLDELGASVESEKNRMVSEKVEHGFSQKEIRILKEARYKMFDQLVQKYSPLFAPEKEKNTNPLENVIQSVESVKHTMNENIQILIENSDHLQSLDQKTRSLEQESAKFKKSSKKIFSMYWWRNTWWKIVPMACIVILLGLAIWFSLSK